MEVSDSAANDSHTLRAENVFWEVIPVILQVGDRQEARKELSVRLLLGSSRCPSVRLLRMYIFCEVDLLFLHTLEVGEDDFQQLKAEQGILVDFSNFSEKLVGLLRKCVASREEAVPQFRALLCESNGQSVFKLVETNDFKQLAHISLCFRPGTDAAVKSFLAFRMSELRRDRDILREQLRSTDLQLNLTQQKVEAQQEELERSIALNSQLRMQAQASVQEVESSARSARIREREEYLRGLERQQDQLQQQHQQDVAVLSQQAERAVSDQSQLRSRVADLEDRIVQLKQKCQDFETGRVVVESEFHQTRKLLQTTYSDKEELREKLSVAIAQLRACQERSGVQESALADQKDNSQVLQHDLQQFSDTCSELQRSVCAHAQLTDDAYDEVTKGNSIIENLTQEIAACKQKIRRKQALLHCQEDRIHVLESDVCTSKRIQHETEKKLCALTESHHECTLCNEVLNNKLLQCKEQLNSNEQMIRWLNGQITAAQISGTAGVSSSCQVHEKVTSKVNSRLALNGAV